MKILFHLFLLVRFLKFSFHSDEINLAVFLNPQTNSAFIQCPLDLIHSLDIQWYDVLNQQYDVNRGRYYRINGLQPIDRALICSSISKKEKFRIQIRTYNRPLPVQYITILNTTNTSLSLHWEDDHYNQNANITSYQLILKYNHIIQSRILINHTVSTHTFFSLHPNTFYSIDITVLDIWKRSSTSKTITTQTLPFHPTEQILSNQIIAHHLLDQSISCYHFNNQFLLVEFNNSKYQRLNHIYNLTIYNNQDRIIFTDHIYSSLIYNLKERNLRYQFLLMISTSQSEYLGKISKDCEDFYPIYSPLTCSIKSWNRNKYHLIIHSQLSSYHKHIKMLKPSDIFYQINANLFIKKKISDIHHYMTDNLVNVTGNYSVIVENNFLNEKLNISILCSMKRIVFIHRISNGVIIGVILLMIILITLGFLLAYRKLHPYVHLFRKNYDPRSCNSLLDENHSKHLDLISIPIDQFPFYVSKMHKDNHFGFIRLFRNMSHSSDTSICPPDITPNEDKKLKNRYEHSRVKLSMDEYINANYVDGHEKTNAYIATQGPRINTIKDFWRMIWEKDVSVIVMVTNIEECGMIKCDVYWPEEGTEIYGNVEVTLVSATSLAYYVKRIFAIRYKNNHKFIDYERLIHQFQYTDWPDHTVPLSPLPILSFIRHSSACNADTNGPIVVHCSTGIGRTGTYIVIDTMLKKLNDQQTLNIPSFLKHIRQQRNNLVQTEEQFIFIYDVLLEVVQLLNIGCQNLELNKQNCKSIIQMLDDYDEDLNSTQLEKQFQLIQTQREDESCRFLWQEAREGCMTVSYLHGYYRVEEFIITQHPMMNMIIDFWQMIWDHKTNVIVALYADEKSPDYWPLLNQLKDYGDLNVCSMNEHFECEYIYRDCLLRSIKENCELRVKIISSSYWPETCSPINTSFNLINTIRNLNSNKPIVVHDHVGGHRAATFCALYTMKEQIENEGIFNVYELARFYHIKRPGIWRHSDDLLYLYRCAEILLHEYESSVLPF